MKFFKFFALQHAYACVRVCFIILLMSPFLLLLFKFITFIIYFILILLLLNLLRKWGFKIQKIQKKII